jgi:hypothetical protein
LFDHNTLILRIQSFVYLLLFFSTDLSALPPSMLSTYTSFAQIEAKEAKEMLRKFGGPVV